MCLGHSILSVGLCVILKSSHVPSKSSHEQKDVIEFMQDFLSD